jgi:hypothetical protein
MYQFKEVSVNNEIYSKLVDFQYEQGLQLQ